MKLTPKQRDIALAILEHPSDSFVELSQLAGLDPASAFREANLRRVDFGTDDLSGFDFSGADLSLADFSRARGLDCALFDGAITDGTRWHPSSLAPEGISIGVAEAPEFSPRVVVFAS